MSAISAVSRAATRLAKSSATRSIEAPGERATAAPLAIQFRHMRQQYDAAKLGMWLFLATEVMLFAGLFCLYLVFRARDPEVFAWGRRLLDPRLGLANTTVLVLSSLTMALAVNCVQLRQRWKAVALLALTFLGGGIFLAVKSVEYEHKLRHGLLPTAAFYSVTAGSEGAGGTALAVGDPATGLPLWNATCRACHGAAGEGVTGQGKDIRQSQFIQSRDDAQLVGFVQAGRPLNDPANTTKLAMPPRGGNPFLKDQDLMHIIAYLRSFQVPVPSAEGDQSTATKPATSSAKPTSAASPDPAAPGPSPASQTVESTGVADSGIDLPRWVVPPPPLGPPGLNPSMLQGASAAGTADHEEGASTRRPARGHQFFGMYFLMTGLHGVHVVAGMGIVAWLMFRCLWGEFSDAYFTPVDLGGLYWHFVDIVWLFLFPAFYLA